jgi:DNA-binding transcriptional LysR family regulator
LRAGEPSQQIGFNSYICVDSIEAMTQLTIEALGVSSLSDFLVEQAQWDVVLKELLPDWQVASVPLHTSWSSNAANNSITRHLLDFICK